MQDRSPRDHGERRGTREPAMTEEHGFLTREFKRYIWPVCRIHGFSRINGRTM